MNKDLFKDRNRFIQLFFVLVAFIFIIRLFYVQIIDTRYEKLAKNNAIKEVDVYPTRGYIYDRNGKLIVFNQAIYDIMIVPREVKAFDTLLLCRLMNLSPEEFTVKWQTLRNSEYYSKFKPNVLFKQIAPQDYARIQEFLYLFPGFYGQVRAVRQYNYPVGALVLGDIGEVSKKEIDKSGEYYKPGEYIGKSGIEKVYERELAGIRGKKYVMVDVHGRLVGNFAEGEFDSAAVSGYNLTTTLDIDIQQLAEELMANKKGSVVAIEPSTGEIIACVSSPAYDPNLLVGSRRSENFKRLNADSLKPLLSRPTMALYPPGSTFKPLIGLIALDEGVQQADYTVPCNGLYHIAGLSLKCSHRHPTATNIEYALNQSCNPYFWQSFRNTLENKDFNTIQESYGRWTTYCKSFQLGAKTGVDLPSEKNGNIPSVNYFNKIYGEKGWRAATIISLGIGQGEVLVTPIQLCNLYAAIANKGFYYTPHVVKRMVHPENNTSASVKTQKHYTRVNPVYFSRVVDGLESVMISGTARLSAIPGIAVCGKTGTVQNPHGKDHAIFCGFAPKENPKIAIAVIVENSGFGGVYAAPIASLLMEKYLNDTISSSRLPIIEKMKNTDLIHSSFTQSISPH